MYSENTMIVADYIKAHAQEDFTAQDIAEATGLGVKTVNGVVTAGLQRKSLAERVPAVVMIKDEEGNDKAVNVKFIKGTPALFDLDMEAANAEETAAKEAEKAAKAAAKAAKADEE